MEENRVKAHFRKYKWVYITVGAAVSFAGITYLIVRGNSPIDSAKAGISDTLAVQKPEYPTHGIVFSNSGSITGGVVNVIHRDGRGHPGYMIRCIETGLTYQSQASAAKTLDISADALSKHLNGKTPHVEGLHFERIHMAS